jgi:putative N6-adenine-specific DNA methylase
MDRSKILVTCPKGIPPILKQELTALNVPILSENIAGVETEGTLNDAMRLNLHLRTGHRALLQLREFSPYPDEMYRNILAMAWEGFKTVICVTPSVDTPSIRDSRFATEVQGRDRNWIKEVRQAP